MGVAEFGAGWALGALVAFFVVPSAVADRSEPSSGFVGSTSA